MKLIDLSRSDKKIKDEILTEFSNIIDNSTYIMGNNVKEFEKNFATYIGTKNAISVGNGTDALVIALKALGIKENDEVITTPYSFFSTCEAISVIGAIPVFVDVKLDTYNIDEEKIEEKITSKTKAILPVHIFGNPCNMNRINEIAKKHNLYVIEDACQAAGSVYDNKKAGNLSDIACFSFFPTKNLGCMGDGGVIVTNNDELATICRALRTHGSGIDGAKAYSYLTGEKLVENFETSNDNTVYNPMKYYNYLIGYNSRLDEMQAAVLKIKLNHLDEYLFDRTRIANIYNEKLKNTSLVLPSVQELSKHVYHLYIVQSEKRGELVAYLKEKEIATGVYYQVPLHLQKAMSKYGYKEGDMPNAEYLSKRTFALPLYVGQTDEELEMVVKAIEDFENGR